MKKLETQKLHISILVAYDKNRVIGNDGRIPWSLSSERNRFKQICFNKKIIMGRKTFMEIGHALPYCTIIIVSKKMTTAPKDCLLADSLEKAFLYFSDDDEILIAGGQEIYAQVLPYTEKIYATEIDAVFAGDRFFPELTGQWSKRTEAVCQENDINYSYITYTRIKN